MNIVDRFKEKNNLSEEQVIKLLKNRPVEFLVCKCGDVKRTFYASGKYLAAYKCCGRSQCESNYGIKRPEHAKLMKEYAKAGKNSGNFQKGYVNNYINSIEWKRKVLQNKNLPAGNTKEETSKLYSSFRAEVVKSRRYRENEIYKFYAKHSPAENITSDYIRSLSDLEFDKLFKNYKSLHHEIFCKDVCGARQFKRTLLTGLKHNLKHITSVYTRSSYETNYVKYFERNCIGWLYEPINFKLDDCKYRPDFFIIHNNKKYFIEVKGFLLNEDEYIQKKLLPLAKKLRHEDARLIFSYAPKLPKNLQQFLEENEVRI